MTITLLNSINTAEFLVLFPLLPALLIAFIQNPAWRGWVVRTGSAVIAAASIFLATTYLNAGNITFACQSHLLDLLFFGGDLAVTAVILFFCWSWGTRQWWIPVLVAAQAGLVAWCELSGAVPETSYNLYVDNFSIIMVLIIGVVGPLICVYAVSYLREYHHHHPECPDKQRSFFFILFLFLSAMFGIVLSNNLVWMYLFWEITTLSSFLLIGYSRTAEATGNAFRALGMNALGGLGFAAAITWQVFLAPTPSIELNSLLQPGVAMLPVALLIFAGLTKAAQMPFSSWLLGAMVAPTPVSAILHSSTMVKAGVFLIVKFAPVLEGTMVGYLVALVGGVTFLATSLQAVTQSNAKRVLAYSTIANLGLIVMCAGVGTPGALWAAVMLIIFHALAKALLFLGTGSIEHRIGSRDIEDMDGLIIGRPALALAMVTGIVGMFLAPFGMLLSKWICLESLARAGMDLMAGNRLFSLPPLPVILLAFGSAPTLFFWAKWLGKLLAVSASPASGSGPVSRDETLALAFLAAFTVAAAGLFPVIAWTFVDPYVQSIHGATLNLSGANLAIMLVMLALFLLLPIAYLFYPRRPEISAVYLAGANLDASRHFQGSITQRQEMTLRNYHLTEVLSEAGIHRGAVWLCSILIACFLALGAL